MTHNYHQSPAMIIFGKWLEIKPMSLSDTFSDYKNQDFFIISSYTQKNGKGLTQWVLVPDDAVYLNHSTHTGKDRRNGAGPGSDV